MDTSFYSQSDPLSRMPLPSKNFFADNPRLYKNDFIFLYYLFSVSHCLFVMIISHKLDDW